MIPTATGVITNTASVSGDELDPDPSDNTVTQTTFVSGVDLSIAKTDDPDPVLVGDALTYILAVTNNGPSISAGVTTTDVLPSSVVFVSVTSTAGTCTESGGTVSCSLGSLAVGQTVTSTIVVIPTATGTITNTASVSGNEPDPDSSNNTVAQTTFVSGADLSIAKTDDPDPVLVLDALTYTLTVTNNGPAVSTGVTTTDVLPSSVVFVSVTSTAGACAESGGVVTCSLGGLAVGDAVTSTIVVIPTAAGTITNTASVSGNEPDPDSSNNSVTQTTFVSGADLAITKTDDRDPVLVLDALTYTLTVTNNGPAVSTGVTTTDVLPSSVVFVSVTSTAGACAESGGVVTCSLGGLAVGDAVTSTIVVIPTAAGTITNTASVSGNESDHDSSNNSATQATVVGGADLAITKTDDRDPVLVLDALTYTLTVTNNGPAVSTGVTTTDVLPSSVAFVSVTSTAGTCTESGGVVTCSLGGLAVGDAVTSTIVVIPTAAGTITNTASVSGNEPDPDSSNNSATQATVVGQVAIGDCECARGKGFWKHAFGGRGNRPFDRSTLEGFLATIRSESAIFDEVFALSGIADASRILNPDRHRGNGNRGNGNGGNNTASDPTMTGKRNRRKGQGGRGGSVNGFDAAEMHVGKSLDKTLTHVLSAWLNFAKGAIDWNEMIDTNRDGVPDTSFGDLIGEVEAIMADPNATKHDLNRAKKLAEAVNSHDKDNPAGPEPARARQQARRRARAPAGAQARAPAGAQARAPAEGPARAPAGGQARARAGVPARAITTTMAAEDDGRTEMLDSGALPLTQRPEASVSGYDGLEPGFRLDEDLTVVEHLGGSPKVDLYLCRSRLLDRYVSCKVLRPEKCIDFSDLEGIIKEGQILCRLSHPNVVTGYAVELERYPRIVMQYLQGQTLNNVFFQGNYDAFSLDSMIGIVDQLAGALSYIHGQGLLHLDVKPSNVMYDSGHVTLFDFSVAEEFSIERPLEDNAGTVEYMAPEQTHRRELGYATDVFALGVLFYQLLTAGELPYRVVERPLDDDARARRQLEYEVPPRPPSAINPKVSSFVDDVALRAVDLDMHRRYQTPLDFRTALARG